jgi:hypothetical protein
MTPDFTWAVSKDTVICEPDFDVMCLSAGGWNRLGWRVRKVRYALNDDAPYGRYYFRLER